MHGKFIASALAFTVAACANLQHPAPASDLPDKLNPSANESLAMIAAAKGSQIYECRAAKNGGGAYEWAFVAPEAELFDASGTRIGRHYAGPLWEATDGSRIAGTVKESADAPRSGAIPWLLLAAKSVGTQGAFSRITSVQRVNTVGGVAPATGCSQSTAGMIARVPYTADYRLLAARQYSWSLLRAPEGPVVAPVATY